MRNVCLKTAVTNSRLSPAKKTNTKLENDTSKQNLSAQEIRQPMKAGDDYMYPNIIWIHIII